MSHLAGISAADGVPDQPPHISRASGTGHAVAQSLDSDSAPASEADTSDASGSDEEQGSESSESDADEAASLSEDRDASDASQSSLEERRAGMPAETSGRAALTPGASWPTIFSLQIFWD